MAKPPSLMAHLWCAFSFLIALVSLLLSLSNWSATQALPEMVVLREQIGQLTAEVATLREGQAQMLRLLQQNPHDAERP